MKLYKQEQSGDIAQLATVSHSITPSFATLGRFSPLSETWKLLIVDDEQDVHQIVALILKNFKFDGKSLQLLHAMSMAEACEILQSHPDTAIALIDIVMETDDAGLQLIDYIRKQLQYTLMRLTVLTGQPGMVPEQKVMTCYDINDYMSKTELQTTRFRNAIRFMLKSHHELHLLARYTEELNEKQNQLLSLQQQFTSVLNHIDSAVYVVDVESHRILFVNNYTKELYGDQLVGKRCWEAIMPPSQTYPCPECNMPQLINSQGESIHSIHWERFDERLQRWFEVENQPILWNNGRVVSLTVATDITEKKQAEAKLQSALQIAEIMRVESEQANRAKSDFLATMSHEIRTPMIGVLGTTELLKRTSLTPEQQHYIEVIHRSGDVLLTLINDILDFSKIEAGKLVLESIEFDLQTLLEDMISVFSQSAYSKNLELLLHCPQHFTKMFIGDPNRLRQIFSNLLSNAIKFTQTGYVTLSVCSNTEMSRKNDLLLRFEVADTGIGISEVQQHRLFQPFSQADSSTTRRFGGTGLGLVIVQRLIKIMGGNMGLNSDEQKGSCFWFELPLRVSNTPIVSPYLPEPAQKLKNRQVIVVSEHLPLLSILQEQLKIWGMRPIIATTLGSAQQQAAQQSEKPRAILIELKLMEDQPQSVMQLCDELAQQGLKIAFINHRVDNPVTELADYCLNKPITLSDLLKCLLVLHGEVLQPSTARPYSLPHVIMSHWQSKQILLAEDNLINQKIICAMLQQLGCQVIVAENGTQVLRHLKQYSFDLIFMDCYMPELDGFSTTRIIRALEKDNSQHIPIIALTADAMADNRKACIAAGMDDYLTKPMNLKDLQIVLARYLPVTPSPATTVSLKSKESAKSHDSIHPLHPKKPVLATEVLDNLRSCMKSQGLQRIIGLFLQELPKYVNELKTAVQAKNGQKLHLAAHKFKGSCANLGATNLVRLCQELEHHGQHERIEEATRVIEEILPTEINQARSALELELETK